MMIFLVGIEWNGMPTLGDEVLYFELVSPTRFDEGFWVDDGIIVFQLM
jgi:hypothetical protein